MQVALITGASGDIGKKIAEKFLKKGYFAVCQYNKNERAVKEITDEFNKKGYKDNFAFYKADFTSSFSIQEFYNKVKKSFIKVDVLVNNAGVDLYKLITETTEKEWDEVFFVNIKSVYLLTNLLLPDMISNRCGKIINISSVWGKVGASMEVAYSASKSALIGYTKALAKELAPSNINVNCVCPGVIDTKMNGRFSKDEMKEIVDAVPIGRIGKAEDVAELVYFLSTDKASYITGEVITVDGGFTL
ncbi:MAG: 3-oxoacyl-ACP reductase FabG [Clostridia bacterium]|nr:3-oxoacyl-ACP reductase FabG [Clostridia bacterium]